MISKAIQRNIHISPRKAGLVADLIRHKKVDYAISQLENSNKKGAEIALKLLRSAVANATNNNRMNASKLYILSIVANEGPTMKRVLPRAKGSANTMRKRSTHLEIIISDDEADRELQKLSYKPHNKYNDLIHGKLVDKNASKLHSIRKSQLIEEQKKKQKDKNAAFEPEQVSIYTKEEFDKVKITEPEKVSKKKAEKEKEHEAKKIEPKKEDKE